MKTKCLICRKIAQLLKRHWFSWVKLAGPNNGVLSHMSHVVRSVSITKSVKVWEKSATKKLATSTTNSCIPCIWNYIYLLNFLCMLLVIVYKVKKIGFKIDLLTVLTCLNQTSLRELTTLGIKNAENLAIPSVRNDVSIYFLTWVWTISFYG